MACDGKLFILPSSHILFKNKLVNLHVKREHFSLITAPKLRNSYSTPPVNYITSTGKFLTNKDEPESWVSSGVHQSIGVKTKGKPISLIPSIKVDAIAFSLLCSATPPATATRVSFFFYFAANTTHILNASKNKNNFLAYSLH